MSDQQPVKCYRMLLHGQNFLMNVEGKAAKLGFYCTRFLRAYDPEGAQEAAFMTLRQDETLASNVLNTPDDGPWIDVEEMEELESMLGVEDPLPPLEWYEMDKEEDGQSGFTRLG